MPARSAGASGLHLRFRSAGSFLVAYTTRLARGELFVETANPWPLGTAIDLRLHAPGVAALDVAASVAWTRPTSVGPGQPPGMGLALSTPIDSFGATIDVVASMYMGTRILLGATDATSRAVIGRYLRSIVACDLLEADLYGSNDEATADLTVIDLDSTGEAGYALVRTLKEDSRTMDVPLIALAQSERDRARAAESGADEVLINPPSFADMHATVLHALSRATVSGEH